MAHQTDVVGGPLTATPADAGAETGPNPAASVAGPASIPFAPTQELRSAVVMYGGVSLAIYMNGVAQELLRLVRSTAPFAADPNATRPAAALESTEVVYRRLAQMVDTDSVPSIEDLRAAPDGHRIRGRFVIDILTGSSAGGINRIFLAKALARSEHRRPAELWVEQGDIETLINDAQTAADSGLPPEKPPQSLLSGPRMYLLLLEAFTGLGGDKPADVPHRLSLVDELDLWVTTTDLRGMRLPLPLANRLTWERRYRNVFHFKYTTEAATGNAHNDFIWDNNPFLAFAARCTSAFPFAFEPMRLQDIDSVLSSAFGNHYPVARYGAGAPEWQRYFSDYLDIEPVSSGSVADPTPRSTPFALRSFGDGGSLDNKPFSYATQTLLRRVANIPVDRKLIFIEPDPGHEERGTDPAERPNAIQSALGQALLLPRQETIRDDLERVFDQNRLIGRIDTLLSRLDEDLAKTRGVEGPAYLEERKRRPVDPSAEAATRDLSADLVASSGTGQRGVAYAAYHRVRVDATTDDLAKLVTSLVGLPEDSRYFDAIRELIRAWRNKRFWTYLPDEDRQGDNSLQTTMQFLADYDLSYRLRRIAFVQRRIDRVYQLDERGQMMLQAAGFVPQLPGPLGDGAQADVFRNEAHPHQGWAGRGPALPADRRAQAASRRGRASRRWRGDLVLADRDRADPHDLASHARDDPQPADHRAPNEGCRRDHGGAPAGVRRAQPRDP